VIDRQEMARPAPVAMAIATFRASGVLRQEVEEHLEEPAVCRAVNRRADDHDPRIQHRLDRLGHIAIVAAAEQGVGRQGGEIDEPGKARRPGAPAPRASARAARASARPASGCRTAYNGCHHSFLLH